MKGALDAAPCLCVMQTPPGPCLLLFLFQSVIDLSQLRLNDAAVILMKCDSTPHVLQKLYNNWPDWLAERHQPYDFSCHPFPVLLWPSRAREAPLWGGHQTGGWQSCPCNLHAMHVSNTCYSALQTTNNSFHSCIHISHSTTSLRHISGYYCKAWLQYQEDHNVTVSVAHLDITQSAARTVCNCSALTRSDSTQRRQGIFYDVCFWNCKLAKYSRAIKVDLL